MASRLFVNYVLHALSRLSSTPHCRTLQMTATDKSICGLYPQYLYPGKNYEYSRPIASLEAPPPKSAHGKWSPPSYPRP